MLPNSRKEACYSFNRACATPCDGLRAGLPRRHPRQTDTVPRPDWAEAQHTCGLNRCSLLSDLAGLLQLVVTEAALPVPALAKALSHPAADHSINSPAVRTTSTHPSTDHPLSPVPNVARAPKLQLLTSYQDVVGGHNPDQPSPARPGREAARAPDRAVQPPRRPISNPQTAQFGAPARFDKFGNKLRTQQRGQLEQRGRVSG